MSHAHDDHATVRRRTNPPVPADVVAPQPTSESHTSPSASRAAERSVSIDGALLDHLVGLVGELVLARNQLVRATAAADPTATGLAAHRVDHLTTRLQEGLMRTRMQPVTALVEALPRLAQDLAEARGHAIRFVLEGDATELDKTVVEALRAPLERLVRGLVTGRLDDAATRARHGKPAIPTATLTARQQGGSVSLELHDDGAGRPLEVDEQAAIERVVQSLGGRLECEVRETHGTTVRLVVPLTLAILSALTLEDGGERYAVPQAQLEEVVRPTAQPLRERIETLQGLSMFRLRGEMLPVTHLGRRLRGARADEEPLQQRLLVLRTEAGRFGLVVDALLDTEELVVKPLPRRLQGLPYYAGAAVRGDGRVALILEVAALAEGLARTDAPANTDVPRHETEATRRMMLVRVRPGRMAAIPVDEVAHIARFPLGALERRGALELARDEQGALPVFTLAQASAARDDWRPEDADRAWPGLVHVHDGRRIGYLVEAVEDIVSVPSDGDANAVLVHDLVHERVSIAELAARVTPEAA